MSAAADAAAAALAQRVLAQRDVLVPLPDGRRTVTLRRPPRVAAARIAAQYAWCKANGARAMAEVLLPEVKRAGVAWVGWTEADLLGAAVGSDAPAAWSADVWALVVEDDVDLAELCITALGEAIVTALQAQQAAEKN